MSDLLARLNKVGDWVMCGYSTCGAYLLLIEEFRVESPDRILVGRDLESAVNSVQSVRHLLLHVRMAKSTLKDGRRDWELRPNYEAEIMRGRRFEYRRPAEPREPPEVATAEGPALPERIRCPRCGTWQMLDPDRLQVLMRPYAYRVERGDRRT